MDFSPISVGMKPQSGGNYKATAKRYDFYSNDAVYTSDRRYSCCGGRSSAADMGIAFYLKGIKNVSLDFCGATVLFFTKTNGILTEMKMNTAAFSLRPAEAVIRRHRC